MRPYAATRPGPVEDLTTAELVAAASVGDRAAFAEIVVRYRRLVGCVVGSYRMQEADAEDATANTWLHAMESLPALREPERLGGWLRTIARRECLALIRQRALEEPTDVAALAGTAREPGPEAAAVAGDLARAIADGLALLTARGRELILALFYLPDASYLAVAACTDMPVGSIGPTRKRALLSLRTGLEDAGFGPDAVVA
jgi:RNA polymerase sigma factor (sigma-70 family)